MLTSSSTTRTRTGEPSGRVSCSWAASCRRFLWIPVTRLSSQADLPRSCRRRAACRVRWVRSATLVASGGRLGVEPRRGREVARLLVEVRRHGPVAGQAGSTSASAARPARAPSASPTATARLRRTTGLPVSASSSSYHCTTCTQSVSSAVAASACSAAIAAWSWNSPRRSRASAACRISTPSSIEVAVPEAAVLLGERDEGAVGPQPRRPTGVVEQHQREQPVGLRVVGRRATPADGSAGSPPPPGRRRRSSPR